ncbi:MAG TPA: arginine deiminase family protein [Saprospiraceae bacterium]|nr:arginine deiminase family protein [Saprospiraceae bacterium]
MKKIVPNINSEYGKLSTVILHEPGLEIDRLTPDNKDGLLFEDVPFLKKMKEEHRAFAKLLRDNGIEVLLLGDLLSELISISENSRNRIVFQTCANQPSLSNILFDNFDNFQITELLFKGLTVRELRDISGIDFSSINSDVDRFLLNPIPNAYFTRDPAAIVKDSIVSCKMHFDARVRETIIFREIFKHHPLFSNKSMNDGLEENESYIIYGGENKQDEDRPYAIEGGDIIVLNEKSIAIGCSQRTRSDSIVKLASNLFKEGKIQRVYQINIPAERAYMHLDTVFTVVDKGIVVAYPNVMNDVREIIRYEPISLHGNIVAMPIEENRNFNTILKSEFGGVLEVINTGNNNSMYASREQLADGTNVFAISPSTVITYDRNIHTNEALEKCGVKVLCIEGSELVRGLGGPRCMTMPIVRE